MTNVTIMKLVVPCMLIAVPCSVYAQSASEDRPVAPFSKLVVSHGIDVELTQAAEVKLRVEVEGWDLEDIVTEVEGETLELSNSRSPVWSDGERRAKVYLDFVELSAIEASGGSDIEGRNALQVEDLEVEASAGSDVELDVHARSLRFKISGGSDLEVRGDTESLVIDAGGGSDVEAHSLETERATVSVAGGSDASLRVNESIVLNAGGGSDVSVFGDPAERTVNTDRSSDVAWR